MKHQKGRSTSDELREVNLLPLDSPDAYKAKVDGCIRLFTYVQEVAKEIGEEKALEILSDVEIQVDKRWV